MATIIAARRGLGALIFLVGLAGLVIAVVMLLIAGDLGLGQEMLRLPGLMAISGAALMVVGRVIRGSDGGLEDLLSDGLDGRATVGGVTATGRTRRGATEVLLDLVVDVAGRPPYPARKKAAFPAHLLPRVVPGASLPVKVDPADPLRLAILLMVMDQESAAAPAPWRESGA